MNKKIHNEMNSNNNHSPIISNQSSVISQSSDLDYLVEVICASGIDIAPTYDEYTNLAFAIATDYVVKHIASAFYLAKQAGVNIYEVRLKRAEERRKQREKCSNVQMFSGITFPHVGARTLL